jgi:hypothetical protein
MSLNSMVDALTTPKGIASTRGTGGFAAMPGYVLKTNSAL